MLWAGEILITRVIEAKVKPNSSEFRVEVKNGITIYTKSPPEKGKANSEITRELSKILGGPVKIVRGHKTNRKLISVPEDWDKIRSHDHKAGSKPR